MKVIELSPGGGWYTEILAPYLKEEGELIAAHFDPSMGDFAKRVRGNFEKKLASSSVYDRVKLVSLNTQYSEAESVDAVVTFRNLHNWIGPNWNFIITSAHKSLKKGGVLGVVEHRAPDTATRQEMIDTAYVSEAYVKQVAGSAGFEFVDSSEINANQKDTKDHPEGVWTLPPNFRAGEVDQNKYAAVGESDRMTLKFRKPK